VARPSQIELHQRLWFERLAHIASRHRGRCRRTLWSRAPQFPVSQCALIPQLPVVKDNGELLLWRGRSGRGGVPPVPSAGEQLRFLQPGVAYWQASFARWNSLRLPNNQG